MSLLEIYPSKAGGITCKSSRIPEKQSSRSPGLERRGAIVRKEDDKKEMMLRLFRARVKFWQVLVLVGFVILVYALTGRGGVGVYTNQNGVLLPRLKVLEAKGMPMAGARNEHAMNRGPVPFPVEHQNGADPNEVGVGEVLRSVACIPLKSASSKAKICIFNPQEDHFISRSLLENGTWDEGTLEDFKMALQLDKELGLIDIGANLGTYSLIAGAEGRRVVAVEACHQTVLRLKKSVQISDFTDRISIVEAAIMPERGHAYVHVPPGNYGAAFPRYISKNNVTQSDVEKHLITEAILLDDLAKFITFEKAILKIDIDGEEYNILQQAHRLFDVCDIRYIFVVFSPYKGSLLGKRMGVQFLRERGYVPKRLVTDTDPFIPLDTSQFPSHLVWVKDG